MWNPREVGALWSSCAAIRCGLRTEHDWRCLSHTPGIEDWLGAIGDTIRVLGALAQRRSKLCGRRLTR